MKRVRATALVGGLAAAAMVLSACGGSDSSGTPAAEGGASSAAEGGGITVGLAYDIGGRGDQSFNDSAAMGLDQATEELGVDVTESSAQVNETEADKEERLRTLADGGAMAVIAVGFAYSAPVAAVAVDYPEVKFAIVDDAQALGDNITNIVFAENESSFLVGAAAALKSTSGTIGFIGGVEIPLIQKFEAGYRAGAEAAVPGTEIVSQYLTPAGDFTGFNDPEKGETATGGLIDQGADVVFHAAGGSGSGVFQAVSDNPGSFAIGVDSDQQLSADPAVQGVILTSALKNVNVGVFEFIQAVGDETVEPGSVLYDLSNDGVGYATSGGLVDDIATQLDELKAQVVDGSVTVPDAL